MNIRSATFVKSCVGADPIFEDGKPQVVFIGRSNVGKSSVINSITNQKNLAKTSSLPGRTQQLNVFLINKDFYLVDLPGYGYARIAPEKRKKIQHLISWYLFGSNYPFKKVVLIIDANVGPKEDDLEMYETLQDEGKDVIIVANKIDKIKKSDYHEQMHFIHDRFITYDVIPFSAEKGIGASELVKRILAD